MKRLLLLSIFMSAVAAAPAVAEQPTDVSGDWTYVPVFEVVKVAGQNTFIEGTDVGTWTGSFDGTTHEEFVVVLHKDHGFYQGEMQFEGFVNGVYGTMEIRAQGTLRNGIWTAHWVIQHADGDLSGLHGNGTAVGPPLDLDYFGQIHFAG